MPQILCEFRKIFLVLQELIRSLFESLDTTQQFVFSLLAVVIAGLIGGVLAKRCKQPLFLGYILGGVVMGVIFREGAFGALQGLANIGVALLLFSMGLEFHRKDIAPVWNFAVFGALIQVFLTLGCGFAVAHLVNLSGASALLFGVSFVSTSTAVVLKTLTAKGRMGTLSSRVMIGLSIVQDLTVMPLVVLICNLKNLESGLAKALLPLCFGTLFLVFMWLIGGRVIHFLLKRISAFNNPELFLLAVTCVGLGVGAIAEQMYMSFSFGAFVAGIVLADSDYGKKALYEMAPVRDIFAMLFFVSVGMLLELQFLALHWRQILLLMILTSFGRTVFLPLLSWGFGYLNVIPTAMFFGMFATSEIAFVVIQSGWDMGFFDKDTYNLILCIVVCSMICGPVMETFTTPFYRFLCRHKLAPQGKVQITLPLPELREHVVIAGTGGMARELARRMEIFNIHYVIVDPVHESFCEDQKRRFFSLYGDPAQDVILEGAGIENAKMFLAVFDSFGANWTAIQRVRKLNPELTILTLGESNEDVALLHSIGVDTIVHARFEAGLEISRQSLLQLGISPMQIQNSLDEVRNARYRQCRKGRESKLLAQLNSFAGIIELNWVSVEADSPMKDRTIAELDIRAATGASVVGIIRAEEFMANPLPSSRLLEGDVVGIIGEPEARAKFKEKYGTDAVFFGDAGEREAKA